MRRPVGVDPTKCDAGLDESKRSERTSPQSSLKEVEANTSSKTNAEDVAPLTPVRTWLFSARSSDFCYRALVLILVFTLWRSLAFSVSIRTASSSNAINNTKGVPPSNLHCNSLVCYSASLSIRKPEGLIPALSSQMPPLISPVLKRCRKDNHTFTLGKMLNGRRYSIMCSDAFMQDSTDINADGGRATHSCLAKCISDNHGCEGVLYLVDRPFEKNCFFQHNDERPVFETGERVLGAKMLKD